MADKKDRKGLKAVKPDPEAKPDEVQPVADAVVQNLIEEFKAGLLRLVDSSDQVIVVAVTGGYVTNVVALDPDRHKVMGALTDAFDLTAYGTDQPE